MSLLVMPPTKLYVDKLANEMPVANGGLRIAQVPANYGSARLRKLFAR
jgi:hypothetical protein